MSLVSLDDVAEALAAAGFVLLGASLNDDRSEEEREALALALGHLDRCRKRLEEALRLELEREDERAVVELVDELGAIPTELGG